MVTQKAARAKKRVARTTRRKTPAARPRFVGRDASPVLDRYPRRESAAPSAGRPPAPLPSAPTAAPPPSPATSPPPSVSPPPSGGPAPSLITLERPFDVDEFSKLLGETSIRVTVPRDALPEVLRRVLEFMGFGIYVYSISVRPAPAELLKSFVVELHRVDFSAEKRAWVPFVERGTTDSPFGPSGAPR